MLELPGLFVVALGAASLLPLQSEPLLVGLLLLGEQPAWLLVAVASAGNTLGSVINWALGRQLVRWQDRRWFPVKPEALDKASGWYRRWGHWSLLLSWAPIIGDPLTLAAGVLREPFWRFLPLVAIAKTGRYTLLALATLGFT
ncbi:YqaA family protein [Falsiroseomonas tokyonensis]|uniref:YqaA family protein n=1 Tax=Falsiroseomonas tokyonensis TaxID=430521 RepID=A0ABV7C251_9PROT|nr:YqaA family protein [Falsiroseomonas tokyonensis]MBU8540540.1 DedA family protein [Falsiroseomonas tokyonensis]